ncbi:MAG: hypothetical protein HY332_15650 [Chloroflexi bacterium]|nr:hypothetical protein [Chloroflexota bacterium]
MWRAIGSLLLTFAALAWAIASVAICFFYASALWRDLFGRFGAFYGAVFAFGCCLIGARYLLRLADRLIEPYSGPFDGSAYATSPRDTFYHDWRAYAGQIIRSRRYALYARTRQWDRLAALEAEGTAPELTAAGPNAHVRPPRRISMAGSLSPDEVARASRRMSAPPHASPERSRDPDYWHLFDE